MVVGGVKCNVESGRREGILGGAGESDGEKGGKVT